MAAHVRAMLAFQAAGAVVFDYGNNLRAVRRRRRASRTRSTIRASCPAFIRPQFCEGRGPFRWAALSGDPADILRTDRAVLELFPDDAGLQRWIEMAQDAGPVPGPAGPDLLAGLRRAGARPGSRSTSWSGPARSARRS